MKDWLTPRASMIGESEETAKKRMERLKAAGRVTGGTANLIDQVKKEEQQMWGTPNVSDSNNPQIDNGHDIKRGLLRGQVVEEEKNQWRTPTVAIMGTGDYLETSTDKDGNPPKVGHRVYNKNGKLIAIDLNRQVEILSSVEDAGLKTQPSGAEPSVSSAEKKSSDVKDPKNIAQEEEQCQTVGMKTTGPSQNLWRTPTEAETHNQQTSNQIYLQNQVGATPNAGDFKAGMSVGRKQKSLGQDVKIVETWATPTARDFKSGRRVDSHSPYKQLNSQLEDTRMEEQKWPTPNANEMAGGSGTGPSRGNGHQQTLNNLVTRDKLLKEEPGSPKLNPRWVEPLMGLPLGWCCPNVPASVIKNWRRFLIGCGLVQAELKNSGSLETE